MDEIVNSYKKSDFLHHAYALIGEREGVKNEIFDFVETHLKISHRGNPDFSYTEYENFGIEDARSLKERSIVVPLADLKIFVIALSSITTEAQNSLLKLFEEPTPNTHFFLILPSVNTLLPTLRSRLQIIGVRNKDGTKKEKFDADAFLGATAAKRMKILEKIIEDKDKNSAEEMLNCLEIYFHGNSKKIPDFDKIFVLGEILKAKSYIRDRSSSVKMILEHISAITQKIRH